MGVDRGRMPVRRGMRLTLPTVAEPIATRRSLATAAPDVRRATLRQASDIATPIYHEWKAGLTTAGISWQSFQASASDNWRAWGDWVDGTLRWRQALEEFISKLGVPPGTVLTLA